MDVEVVMDIEEGGVGLGGEWRGHDDGATIRRRWVCREVEERSGELRQRHDEARTSPSGEGVAT